MIEAWRVEYNEERAHRALQQRTNLRVDQSGGKVTFLPFDGRLNERVYPFT